MSQQTIVRWLDELTTADLPHVGGKLARLGAQKANGLRVPDGFAVPVQAFELFLSNTARTDLELVLAQPAEGWDAGERVATEARRVIESQAFPSDMEDAISAAHDRLAERSGLRDKLQTAVRSSGVTEDGDEASFAGQFDTYLGIRGASEVLVHVRKCWASQYTARALDYRRRRGLPLLTQGIAVGVLQLVDARSAGVAFTLNPIDGNRDQAVVEGNWGFGESVVSGLCTPDHWVVDKKTGEIVEEVIAAKSMWSTFDAAAGRVIECAAPAGMAEQPCLTQQEVLEIIAMAVAIEDQEGRPQDVEWTIAHHLPFPDNVFLLQHRPETVWTGREATPKQAPRPKVLDVLDAGMRGGGFSSDLLKGFR
ncbi:MAG TPA: PEP/pyruvate-binding domain-containing protein [Chloroflexota bacterium]|nr:PEP/pyruvate-binding domain-containing protein [Chloroflexota bacterium]